VSGVQTQLAPLTFLPELRLHLAPATAGLWDGGYSSDRPPPFWAFAWPGGQALARYILDHPDTVQGRTVLDLACGSGLVALAAAHSHSSRVRAVDLDEDAITAVAANAATNGVQVEGIVGDLADLTVTADVGLVGDGFYTRSIADGMTRLLLRSGADVYVGDPDREFLPKRLFTRVATYEVPVRANLEGVSVKRTHVWRLNRRIS